MKNAYRFFLILCFSGYFIGRFNGMIKKELIKRELMQLPGSITLTDFENALESNGITYSDKKPHKPMLLTKPVDGACYIIDGYGIEVYQFNLRNPESMRAHSRMATSEFEGVNRLVNKDLILVPYEEHPEWDQILKVFNSL